MTTFEVFRAANESYLVRYGAEKEALVIFAKDLRAWGNKHLTKTNKELEVVKRFKKERQTKDVVASLEASEHAWNQFPSLWTPQ
jgi:hypothetical protein